MGGKVKNTGSVSQLLLMGSICVIIAAVVSTVIITNTTLRSVENNLPNTLIKELSSLEYVLEQLSDVVTASALFAKDPADPYYVDLLHKVHLSANSIDSLRRTYVFDNLLQASAFHAIVAPAMTDLEIWLTEGISGYGPQTPAAAWIMLDRISAAFEKARSLNHESRQNAEDKFQKERDRLNRFLFSVNVLFMLTLLITVIMVFLFARQHFSRRREMEAKSKLKFQKDLLNSLFEGIRIGIMVWGKNGSLLFSNRFFFELTGYLAKDIVSLDGWFENIFPDPADRVRAEKKWRRAGRYPDSASEHVICCKTGEKKTIEFRNTFLADNRSLVTLTDVTERRKGEAHLHHFKTAVELSSDAIGMSDPKGRHWYQNQAFDDMFGAIGQDPPATLYRDEQVGRQVFQTIMAGGQWTGEVEMYGRDGSLLSVLLRAYAIKDESGTIIGLVGTHTDMTRQKEAEKALQQREAQYRAVVENTPDLLYRTDMNGVILFISSSVQQLSGYTVEEAVGMKMADQIYLVPQERQQFLEMLAEQGSVRNFEARLKRKDGSVWWASTNAHFFRDEQGNIAGVEGITRDITETRRAQAALKESEERFKIAGEASYDLIYEWDVKTDSLEWFGDIDTFLGFDKGEISSNIAAWLALIHPDDRKMLEGAVQLHRTSTQPINYEYRIHQKNGAWRYWKDNALPLLDDKGVPFRWIGICADITERKESEQALLKSEQQTRAILDASPDPMVMYDIKGHPLFVNPSFTKVFGWTLDELGKAPIPFVPEDQRELTIRKIEEIYRAGQPLSFETRRYTKDRQTLDIFLSAAVIKNSDGNPTGMVVNLTDITDKKALEAQSEHAQKMESIGTLAGGIAHDFNNLLSGIFGYLDLAQKKNTNPKISTYLSKAFSASERAKGLTHQLLTFSKGGTPVKKVEPLTPFLQDTCQFALSGANVACSFEIDPELWMCDYDKNQIAQVIDNIIINAQHAMPSGGNVKVSAANHVLQGKTHPGLNAGRYVNISISDTGTGIQKKYMNRIFDPFFTTKHKGSGLGLATSYSIMKRHGGIIEARSELGRGSTFHLFLPAADEVEQAAAAVCADNYRGSGAILIMDDEEMIREMLTEMLESMGFSVVSTSDGATMLEAFDQMKAEAAASPFRAVILDLTIKGGMGGKEAVARIRKKDADIPVFVASGYSKDDAIANPQIYGFTASLQKPFSLDGMVRMFEKYLHH